MNMSRSAISRGIGPRGWRAPCGGGEGRTVRHRSRAARAWQGHGPSRTGGQVDGQRDDAALSREFEPIVDQRGQTLQGAGRAVGTERLTVVRDEARPSRSSPNCRPLAPVWHHTGSARAVRGGALWAAWTKPPEAWRPHLPEPVGVADNAGLLNAGVHVDDELDSRLNRLGADDVNNLRVGRHAKRGAVTAAEAAIRGANWGSVLWVPGLLAKVCSEGAGGNPLGVPLRSARTSLATSMIRNWVFISTSASPFPDSNWACSRRPEIRPGWKDARV